MEAITKEQTSQVQSRQSNFELLRIICMVLIVAHHFSMHSVLPDNVFGFNKFLFDAFAVGGKIAVNVFIFITGYFMVKSSFKPKKLLYLVLQTFFYCCLIYFLFLILGYYTFDVTEMFDYVLGFYTKYWFMTGYLILYALSPFLNKIINNSSQKSLILLILIAIALQNNLINIDLGNLVWFCTMYFIGAYIRIYPNKIINSFRFNLILTIILFIAIILFNTLLKISLWDLKNIVGVLASITLFCLFKNINIKNNKVINFISSATLGIYLIHDNPIVRPVLWNNWLNVGYHIQSNNFWIFTICAVLLVFTVCLIIEILRILLDKLFKKLK